MMIRQGPPGQTGGPAFRLDPCRVVADTIEDTSFFLHLTVRDTRPVVVTGSMRSASETPRMVRPT